jgi:hypothetical protein
MRGRMSRPGTADGPVSHARGGQSHSRTGSGVGGWDGNQDQEVGDQLPSGRCPLGYEPPRVERVLAPADLEREVLYAGLVSADTPF